MELFTKSFKQRFPFTYPRQGHFLPRLGLIGTLRNGVFDSRECTISDPPVRVSFRTDTEYDNPREYAFNGFVQKPRIISTNASAMLPTQTGASLNANVLFKIDFSRKGEFYYKALHLYREYIHAPYQLENILKEKLETGAWEENYVFISSLLYARNPVIIKSEDSNGGVDIRLKGTVDASARDPLGAVGVQTTFENIRGNVIHIQDDNETPTVVGFQMMKLQGIFSKKRLKRLKDSADDNYGNSQDYLEDIYENVEEAIDYQLIEID